MANKKIKLAPNGSVSFVTLPGNSGEFSLNMESLDDTTFYSTFKSMTTDIGTWTITSNALYKGYSGYAVKVKKTGTAVAFTGEAMSQVTGQTYKIVDVTKEIWDHTLKPTIYDGATDVSDKVEKINYLFGSVTFLSSYVVVGAITADGKSVPSSQICKMNTFSLTQSAETNDDTDLCVAQTNEGFRSYSQGLKSVALEMSGFYASSSAFTQAIKDREVVIIEINPDGIGKLVCRGFFKYTGKSQSGNAGALEEESVQMELYVPDDDDRLSAPFDWFHAADSTLNTAVRTALDAWETGDKVEVKYLPDGLAGVQGEAILSDMSMSTGLASITEFSVSLQGVGGITNV